MEKKLNCLNKHKYTIGSSLHKELYEANKKISSDNTLKMKKDISGIYIINFKVLNRKDKILIYNYAYYRTDFCESLIVYCLLRYLYTGRVTDEFARKILFIIR